MVANRYKAIYLVYDAIYTKPPYIVHTHLEVKSCNKEVAAGLNGMRPGEMKLGRVYRWFSRK